MNQGKTGKHILSEGQQLVWQNVLLTSTGLTGPLLPAGGVSGAGPQATPLWVDVYGISITGNDTTIDQITLSDGANTITWFLTTTAIEDDAKVPYRFNANGGLTVSAASISSSKSVSFSFRGVISKT
jgi:hypothetical protein